MLSENGIIEEITDDKIHVRIKHEPCEGGCVACGRGSARADKIITLKNNHGFNTGDNVTLTMNEKDIIKNGLIAYGTPIIVLMVVAIVLTYIFKLDDVIVAISSLVATLLSWFMIKLYKPNEITVTLAK